MNKLQDLVVAITAAVAVAVTVSITTVTPTPPPNHFAHGTVTYPMSRVYRVYKSNPERPNFTLAANAIKIDSKSSYYTWNELSRNIPDAVKAKLPVGFNYSKWVPDGQLASGGRVSKKAFPRTYTSLDQVSADWPTTPVKAGQTITVQFLATAAHNPSVWDVWMTKPGWTPKTALKWSNIEHLGRPKVTYKSPYYTFSLTIPKNRSGHHVLWIPWQRNDPVGEVFFSTCDVLVKSTGSHTIVRKGCGATLQASGAPQLGGEVRYAVTGGKGSAQLLWVGFGATNQTMCTGCMLGAPFDILLPGTASAKVPNDPKLIGLAWYIQGADFGDTTGGCNYGGGFDFKLTDTVRTVLGR